MTVFASNYASHYDAMYADKDYVAECDLVAAAARSHGVTLCRVLDVGCGTGGHSLEWGSRSVACVGVDMSPAMINLAEQKAADVQLPAIPVFQAGDARDFSAPGTFDVATMMFAVLGYMNTNADVRASLDNIRRHLLPGGLFVFDFWYGPAVLSVQPEARVRTIEAEGGQTIRAASTRIDSLRHLAHVNFKLWSLRDDKYLGFAEETHVMRFFFPQEIELFLNSAQFEMLSLRSFPENGPLTDETWNAVCVARAV